MRKLLWIGDAVASTGFAKATHETLKAFDIPDWEPTVLGLNYLGDPHDYPYKIYPAWPGGDAFGVKRTAEIVAKVEPDIIVIQNDPWNIQEYLKEIPKRIPVVATLALDGKNCMHAKQLNVLHGVVVWTNFAAMELRAGGYTGPLGVIPLGVDLDRFKPLLIDQARKEMGLPQSLVESGYIVGNVNRNQPRKRLDLTVRYFCKWIREYDVKDAFLYLHIAPTGDKGYDCKQLMHYYGVEKRLIICQPDIGTGIKEESLPFVYNSFDVQFSTTQGEGWGLTTMEGMACGVPQIVPNWSALGDWAQEGVRLVPCTSTEVTPNFVNIVGGIMDEEKAIIALQELYESASLRYTHGGRGLRLVQQPRYRWPNIAQAFRDFIEALPAKQEEQTPKQTDDGLDHGRWGIAPVEGVSHAG